MKHDDRYRRISKARTSMIDALRLIDEHRVNEALVGCFLAAVWLLPLTTEQKVSELVETLTARAA